jgi:hypothetical protein
LDSKKFLLRTALSFALLLVLFGQGFSLKHDPGRRGTSVPVIPGIIYSGLFNLQGGALIPGLIWLKDFGTVDRSANPSLLYFLPGQAPSDWKYYFARRIDISLEKPFLVAGFSIQVPPKSQEDIVPFPEIMIVPESRTGGPDVSHPLAVRQNLKADPGSSEILVDLSAEEIVLSGPSALYLVVAFPPSGSPGAEVMMDTDQDAGFFPRTSFIAQGDGSFLSFEEAAASVRHSLYGMDDLPPPGFAAALPAFSLAVYSDSLSTPLAAPVVLETKLSDSGALRVRLDLKPLYADGRPFKGKIEGIRAFHYIVETRIDSVIGDFQPDSRGWIEIGALAARAYLLRFAAVGESIGAGLAGGARLVLVADPYEPDNSTAQAAELTWSDTGDWAWREAVSLEAGLGSAQDFDFYRLDLAGGDSLVVDLTGDVLSYSSLDPLLSLLDSSGTVLGYSAGAQAAVSLTVETGGRYYALVNDRAFLEGKSFSSAVGKAYQLRVRVLKRSGDVDGNGRIDFRDAFLVFLLVQNMTDSLKFTPAQRLAADFNGNGKVLGDLDDFLLILRAATYIPSRDPNRPDKEKAAAASPVLSAAGDNIWRITFTDGSSVRLSLTDGAVLENLGPEAEKLLALVTVQAECGPYQASLPKEKFLTQNFPNPFNPSTTIAFTMQCPARARIEIFNVQGRKICSLYDGFCSAGTHHVLWAGTDNEGRKLSSGVYFYRLQTEDISITRKMLLLK